MLLTDKIFMDRMTGKLLGDGSMTIQKNRKPRFQFIHRASDLGWTINCYEKLNEFIPLSPPAYKRVIDNRISLGYTECYYVQSRTHDIITKLEKIWYKNRIKRLPFYIIEQYLNEEGLAWWYQDDGHLKQDNGIPRKIIFSTDNFTPGENNKLVHILKKKFNLNFSIDSQNRLILYDQCQILYFLRLIEHYIHQSMERKQLKPTPRKQLVKTTTIYLPAYYRITKPTSEINTKLEKLQLLLDMVYDRKGHIQFYKENLEWMNQRLITKSYRIIIQEKYKAQLSEIQRIIGLTNSKIIEWCFRN